jgi:hypothetical protein
MLTRAKDKAEKAAAAHGEDAAATEKGAAVLRKLEAKAAHLQKTGVATVKEYDGIIAMFSTTQSALVPPPLPPSLPPRISLRGCCPPPTPPAPTPAEWAKEMANVAFAEAQKGAEGAKAYRVEARKRLEEGLGSRGK